MTEETVSSMMTDIDDELAQIQDEEASKMLSELRTESSSVYVKKKDKYTDLKFSGISFIVFGLLGLGLLALNLFEYINHGRCLCHFLHCRNYFSSACKENEIHGFPGRKSK